MRNITGRNKIKQPVSFSGELLRCFAFNCNLKSLMSTNVSKESVGAIHGLRFFGLIYVIMAHTIYYMADYLENIPFAYRLVECFLLQIISNATYVVDGFFFIRLVLNLILMI